jgi:hypothetical protein
MNESDVFRPSPFKSDPSGAGKGREDSRWIPDAGPLNLDDLRPQGSQMHAEKRACQVGRQINHPHTVQMLSQRFQWITAFRTNIFVEK